MIRKTVLAAGIGAVVLLGASGVAVAAESDTTPTTPTPSSGPTSPTPTPTPSPTAQPHRNGRHGNVAFPGEFAQWTTFDAKTNTSTVHDGIRGQVSSVSASSITVKAANGTAQTFAVDANTAVRARGGMISQVKVGDQVGRRGHRAGQPDGDAGGRPRDVLRGPQPQAPVGIIEPNAA